jgi:hypothetical protein
MKTTMGKSGVDEGASKKEQRITRRGYCSIAIHNSTTYQYDQAKET